MGGNSGPSSLRYCFTSTSRKSLKFLSWSSAPFAVSTWESPAQRKGDLGMLNSPSQEKGALLFPLHELTLIPFQSPFSPSFTCSFAFFLSAVPLLIGYPAVSPQELPAIVQFRPGLSCEQLFSFFHLKCISGEGSTWGLGFVGVQDEACALWRWGREAAPFSTTRQ